MECVLVRSDDFCELSNIYSSLLPILHDTESEKNRETKYNCRKVYENLNKYKIFDFYSL